MNFTHEHFNDILYKVVPGHWLKKIQLKVQLTLLPEVNPNETEGMPEKARKGYAALSDFIGSNLENKTHARWSFSRAFCQRREIFD